MVKTWKKVKKKMNEAAGIRTRGLGDLIQLDLKFQAEIFLS